MRIRAQVVRRRPTTREVITILINADGPENHLSGATRRTYNNRNQRSIQFRIICTSEGS